MGARRRRPPQALVASALILAGTALLPGRFAGDPVLLDSLATRVKTRVLTLGELFRPESTEVVNPYYRPVFNALHAATDALTGESHVGLRLLALLCHAAAAFALLRLAAALRLRRAARLAAVALFLCVPGNVATAAYPVAGHWPLSAALVWFAAADLIRFVSCGRRRLAVRGLLVGGASLWNAETGYHLVALLALLAAWPPTRAARRARALALLPIAAAVAALHFALFAGGAQGLVAEAPAARIANALRSWPRYLEGALGGDPLCGERAIAWAALLLVLLGGALRGRGRGFLILFALSAAFPFAALGHNARYGLFASGIAAVAFAALAPRGVARLLAPARALRGAGDLSRRRAVRLALPALATLLCVALILQGGTQREAIALAGRETASILAGVARELPRGADPRQVALVNAPASARFAVFDHLRISRREDLVDPAAPAFLRTSGGYFGASPLDLSASGARHVLVFEPDAAGFAVSARSAADPFAPLPMLPWVFLAGGFEVFAAPPRADAFERQRFFDELVARTRALERPLESVLVERAPPGLGSAAGLPRESLRWRVEERPSAPGAAPLPGFLGMQLVADVELDRHGFLVAVTWLAAEDPLRRVTGAVARIGDSLEARLDGAPAAIEPVFVHACGIVVPPGSHQVVLRARRGSGNEFDSGGAR